MAQSTKTPTITQRLRAAWHAITGQRSDPLSGTFGASSPGHGFAGGAVGRLTASLASWSGSINADNDLALPILRARARSLAANNEHGKRFLSLVAKNIVGRRHPRLQVRATNASTARNEKPTLDKPANDAIEIHWERWGRTADITGRHKSLYALLRTAVKAVARDGETLVRIIRNRKLPYGMALQLLESDRLDDGLNQRLDNGNTIRQGVEIDSTGRAVACYIKTAHPGENYATLVAGVERVPASDIIHLFMPERAEQVRGVTWLHAVIVRASIIHNFEEAAVVAAQIGASKVAALERAEDAPGDGGLSMADGTSNGTATGIPQMKVEAGEMFELPPGYKLSSWNPDYPHQNFESFLKACLRGLAAGLDVAAHNLTGDLADVNFSTGRIGENNERETWMILQDWFIESLCAPIYEQWLSMSLLLGAITFESSGKSLPAEKFDKFFRASRFQGRRWQGIDPQKEAEADTINLENMLTSRTRLAAERGDDFDEIVDEREQEEATISAAGLAPPAPAAPAAPPTDPQLAKAIALIMSRLAEPAATTVNNHITPQITTPAVDARSTINVAPAAAPEVTANFAPPAVNVPATELHIHNEAPVVDVDETIERDARGEMTKIRRRAAKKGKD